MEVEVISFTGENNSLGNNVEECSLDGEEYSFDNEIYSFDVEEEYSFDVEEYSFDVEECSLDLEEEEDAAAACPLSPNMENNFPLSSACLALVIPIS